MEDGSNSAVPAVVTSLALVLILVLVILLRCTRRGKKLWKSIKRRIFSDSSAPSFSGSLNFSNDRNSDLNNKPDISHGGVNNNEKTKAPKIEVNACYSNPAVEVPPYTTKSDGNEFHLTVETKKFRPSSRPSSANNVRRNPHKHNTDHRKSGHSRLVSKPSITSGYISDVDNESTTGSTPYSSRKNFSKSKNVRRSDRPRHRRRRRRRRNSASASNIDLCYDSKKYATTSALTLGTSNKNNEMKRRHSMLLTTNNIRFKQVEDLHQHKQCKRSASDAYLSQQHQGLMMGFRRFSLRHSHHQLEGRNNNLLNQNFLRQPRKQENESNQDVKSANKNPVSGCSLVRSMTILEFPIIRNETAEDHPQNTDTRKQKHYQHENYSGGKKSGNRPSSSYGAVRKTEQSRRRKEYRQPRDKWMYGYNSLPIDWKKTDSMLQQMGMTTESLVEPIEKLDIEKLSRPMPSMEDEQKRNNLPVTDL